MMPTRWPRPQGTRVSRARTPRPTCWSIRARLSAGGRLVLDRDAAAGRSSGGPPSIGRPRPSSDPAEQLVADRDRQRPAGGAHVRRRRAGRWWPPAAGRPGRPGRWRRPRRAPARRRRRRAPRRRSPTAAATPRDQQVQAEQLGDRAERGAGGRRASARRGARASRSRAAHRQHLPHAVAARWRRAASTTVVVGLDERVAAAERRVGDDARRRAGERRRARGRRPRRGAGGRAAPARRAAAPSARRTAPRPGSSATASSWPTSVLGELERRARTAWVSTRAHVVGDALARAVAAACEQRLRRRRGARPRGAPRRSACRSAASARPPAACASAARRPSAQPTA